MTTPDYKETASWQYAVWFGVAFGLLLLARLPFLFIQYVPFHVPFEPGSPLIPLLGVLWGPPAYLAAALSSLAGDALAGMWEPGSAYRAIAAMLYGWSARVLWRTSVTWKSVADDPSPGYGPALRFVLVSVPGCFIATTWAALGSDGLRWYPFSYVGSILILHHLVFLLVLGAVIYRIALRDVVPRLGVWSRGPDADVKGNPSLSRTLCHLLGAFGAFSIGMIVANHTGYPPFRTAMLGDTVGIMLWLTVLPFLLLQLIGLIGLRKRGTKSNSVY